MTDQINYDELLSIFQNMDPMMLKFPVIPMGVYLQEAADLYAWLQPDKEKLFVAGLNRQLVESLLSSSLTPF